MTEERIKYFEDLGKVLLKKSNKSKRLTIRVLSATNVVVTIPLYVSFNRAEVFIIEKSTWIRQVQEKLRSNIEKQTIFHEQSEFSTCNHVLLIERFDGETVKRKIHDGRIIVSVPFSYNITSEEVQVKIRAAITEAWRKEAKSILPVKIRQLSEQYGFKYNSLSIKNMKTRWGSCTGKNGINLNLHLVRLPEMLQDYVILHELVHTLHKNHGKYFWEKLETICGGSKIKAKELRKFRLEIW